MKAIEYLEKDVIESELVVRLLHLLKESEELEILPSVLENYRRYDRLLTGEVEVKITVANKSPSYLSKWENMIAKSILDVVEKDLVEAGVKVRASPDESIRTIYQRIKSKLTITEEEDPSIIEGYKVAKDEIVVDVSLRTTLESVEQQTKQQKASHFNKIRSERIPPPPPGYVYDPNKDEQIPPVEYDFDLPEKKISNKS